MNKMHEAWKKIFLEKKFDITEDIHFIDAFEIKRITGEEPRNMAKVDSSKELPSIFKKYGYFLLPVKNGKYAIVRGSGFHILEQKGAKTEYVSRIKFPLTTAGRGLSEMQYLDYSFNSGALESILGVSPLYQSIRGREYSKEFSFFVNQTRLNVNSVQMEVDSGLEGEDCIVLVEAKINTPDDFIVRQLFYPYNHFKKISPNKRIVPVFFTYDSKTKLYNFWIYDFSDLENYNSIYLKEVRTLAINTERTIQLDDIKPKGLVVHKGSIPQANDLDKVVELVFKVDEGLDDYKKVAEYFEFNPRQSSYYREAAEALGLVLQQKGKYFLTDIGKKLTSLKTEKRNLLMVELLNDFSLVKNGFEILKEKHFLTFSDLEDIVRTNSGLSDSTVSRRANSLFAWFKWMSKTTGSFVLKDDMFINNG